MMITLWTLHIIHSNLNLENVPGKQSWYDQTCMHAQMARPLKKQYVCKMGFLLKYQQRCWLRNAQKEKYSSGLLDVLYPKRNPRPSNIYEMTSQQNKEIKMEMDWLRYDSAVFLLFLTYLVILKKSQQMSSALSHRRGEQERSCHNIIYNISSNNIYWNE